MHYYLKNASELLRAYNIELAADTLHKILNNPELVAANKAQHDAIVEEAKNYGKYMEANYASMKANAQPQQSTAPQFVLPGQPHAPNLGFAERNAPPVSGNGYSAPNFNNKGNK